MKLAGNSISIILNVMNLKTLAIALISLIPCGCSPGNSASPSIEVKSLRNTLMTDLIQNAIDSLAGLGVGVVVFSADTFLTGGLVMRSGITLKLQAGTVLQGSENYLDYGSGKWREGLIVGDSLENISIIGAGIIDGVNCKNPKGEEGFRGPHAIRLTNCRNIRLENFSIIRSGNWAINCRHVVGGFVKNVKISGGHDGLHTRFCSDFIVEDCDFRTGDDCFAGNDNTNFVIKNCKINTSCNGFRIGVDNLEIRDCVIWGPGEYAHLSQNRNNMLSAFVHFSPKDENPKRSSGNWKISNLTVNEVDVFFDYNFKDGLWQTGQPLTSVSMNNVEATNLKKSFLIRGDSLKQFSLSVSNSSFTQRDGSAIESEYVFEGAKNISPAFFNVSNFDSLSITNTKFETKTGGATAFLSKGKFALLKQISIEPAKKEWLLVEKVASVSKD